jgi:hypothetical protein
LHAVLQLQDPASAVHELLVPPLHLHGLLVETMYVLF